MDHMIRNMDIIQIQEYQNSRYPCLMIDYVEELIPGKKAKGYKNFTYNEWFFPAHFEDDPNVPSSIQIEAMSQMLLMTFLSLPGNKRKNTACLKMDNVVFRKKIIPGKRLDIVATLKSYNRGLAVGNSVGYVEDELACQADFVITIPEILKQFSPSKST